jgi:hypothetical protein
MLSIFTKWLFLFLKILYKLYSGWACIFFFLKRYIPDLTSNWTKRTGGEKTEATFDYCIKKLVTIVGGKTMSNKIQGSLEN